MKRYYVGIDLGGTNTKIGVLGKDFNIIKKASFRTQDHKSPKQLISAIKDTLHELLRQTRISLKDVIGVGIGVAGLVNAKTGRIYRLVNIKGWTGINIKKILERMLCLPSYVDNDVNVMALAEFRKGAGKGRKNIVCVALGTGVGGGIIIDGKLYRGSSSVAGEIGHIPINESGPACNCGGTACIEAYVGNKYIARQATRLIRRGKETILRKKAQEDPSGITPEVIYEAAKQRDRFAIELWKDIGKKLGVALTGIINMLNPELIIVGGGVAGAGSFLLGPAQEVIKRRAMDIPRKCVRIVRASLGSDAGLIGAAVLVETERKARA